MLNRINDSLTSKVERRILNWICARLPESVTPNGLTTLGVIGGILIFAGFATANLHPALIFVALPGLAMNWLGDSLDGSLARYRKIERPRIGFFIDHMSDAFVMLIIALGGGLLPQVSLAAACCLLAAYYLMTILTLINCHVMGVMRISYNGIGPTEVRLGIAAFIVSVYWWPDASLMVIGTSISVFDVLLYFSSAILIAATVFHAYGSAKNV
jgi:archaetidylinositol phosphate synthase